MNLKNIKLKADYMHQGVKMSAKLVYGVPESVAVGMSKLGLALRTSDEADLVLEHLTWDSGTALYAAVQPDAVVHPQSAD